MMCARTVAKANRVATLSGLILTLKQTEAQQTLKIVSVSYGYTLTCSEVEAQRNLSFDVSVDILGDDVLSDDVLAVGVDRHIVECGGVEPIEMRRGFLVGQSLLDEDVGGDEIKLRVWARDSAGGETSADTGIVRGNF
jgi:co-chaperonin GroES (HSP10)